MSAGPNLGSSGIQSLSKAFCSTGTAAQVRGIRGVRVVLKSTSPLPRRVICSKHQCQRARAAVQGAAMGASSSTGACACACACPCACVCVWPAMA